MTSLNVIFMGTPDFSVTALKKIIESGHNVIAAYSQPPRPKGRGQKLQKSPVHLEAEAHNIPVFTPVSFKKEPEAIDHFQSLNADIAVVAAYGLILPKQILEAPRFGCLNIHASLLPRWRGAAPIQRAILAGDHETGVTIMQMDEGLDTGAMISKKPVPITEKDTASTIHDSLSMLGGKMIVEALETLSKTGTLPHTPQPENGTTYAHMLKKEEGRIDWSKPAEDIDRQIRALNPWPGVWCETPSGKRLKILEAEPASTPPSHTPPSHTPPSLPSPLEGGRIQVGGPKDVFVACGNKRRLQLITVQPEGKKPMDIKAALNGGYLNDGDVLL